MSLDLGEFIGKGIIPTDRQDWVIRLIGESFKSPFHALRQYIDNGNDSMKLRRLYDEKFDNNLIIIIADKTNKSIRIVDFGTGIVPKKPIYTTPSGKYIYDENKRKQPYINSFENMKNNICNSVKEFLEDQSGQNATGMLAFIALNCKKVEFISRVRGETYTYTITKNNEFYIKKGGDKVLQDDGTEVFLENIDKRIFDNHFNPRRLELELRTTYSEEIARGNININLKYITTKKRNIGRPESAPFIKIKPMEIKGRPFEPKQIKTRSGHLIHLNLKLKDRPSDEAFIRINCKGAGGIPASEVLYDPVWENKYTWGYIHADFLTFAGNDKSRFRIDENLREFMEVMEEKIVPKLVEEINKIKSKNVEEQITKMLKNLEIALSRTLRKQDIDISGTGPRTKQCPQCEKIVSINQQTCPRCGYEWPKAYKNCKFCGKQIPSNAKTCPYCGKDLIEKIQCPFCGAEISKLSYRCPVCGEQLREPPERRGKTPHILPQPLGPYNPRSSIDKDEKTGVIKVIQINSDHPDYERAQENGFLQLYIPILCAREISKYCYGKEKKDYTEDLIGILIGMIQELISIKSIKYKEIVK